MRSFRKLILLTALFFVQNTFSQIVPEEGQEIIQDLLFLADGFASPASESAAYQATASWFTSARALEPWKVDVSLHGNGLLVPSSKKEFTVNNNDFQNLTINDGDRGALLPTAFGKDSNVMFKGSFMGEEFSFQAIEGIDKGALFYPFAQVSVGLPYGFQIGVRALPELEIDGSQFSTYGAGLKYNISQHFRFNKEDDFQLAAIVAYDLFDVKYEFEQISVPNLVNLDLIDVSAGVWLAEVMASKKYENFEVFGAFGVAQSDFEYEFGGDGIALGLVNSEIATLNDKEAQFKGDIGFNLYFERFKISTMATAGKFVNLNLGLHFIL
ncbi:hypothetical protein C8P64_2480 [Christiangramia gaetbulicola]|uniref:Outer membrane protein with beta-barrel domain n=1 Tax=Christiangramia gaetbulicola TaxID=703340 RepID=A0A2T6AE58_9FLAO|nr:DUF6588 family protein [Christiangramia gaetbulicola]PTX42066.1 hypothetical protein C8P64_2480 [Christiangramia gaetbulicola]